MTYKHLERKLVAPAAILATANITDTWAIELGSGFTIALITGIAFAFHQPATETALAIGGLLAAATTLAGKGRCPTPLPVGPDNAAGLAFTLIIAVFFVAFIAGVQQQTQQWAKLPASTINRKAGRWALTAFIIIDLGLFPLQPGGIDPWGGLAPTWLLPTVALSGAILIALGLFLRTDPTWIIAITATLLLAAETMLWLQQPLQGTNACDHSSGRILLIAIAFTIGAFPTTIIRSFRQHTHRNNEPTQTKQT